MSTTTMEDMSFSSNYYCDDDDDNDCDYGTTDNMSGLSNAMERFQFTNLDRLNTTGTDDSWEVESYAADSMEITKMRLKHLRMGAEDDGSSVACNNYVIPDQDDWTVQSECNDSIGLATNRLEMKAEQYNKVAAAKTGPALARITRRRASMGEVVHQQGAAQSPRPQASRPSLRRMSLSSVATVEESLSSHGSGANNSDDPAGRRPSVVRHKSMPYVKAPSMNTTVALWPAPEGTPRQKFARRVSNGGTPCAA